MTRAVAQKNAPGSGVLWVVVAVVVPPASVEVTVVVTVGMISEVWGGCWVKEVVLRCAGWVGGKLPASIRMAAGYEQ